VNICFGITTNAKDNDTISSSLAGNYTKTITVYNSAALLIPYITANPGGP